MKEWRESIKMMVVIIGQRKSFSLNDCHSTTFNQLKILTLLNSFRNWILHIPSHRQMSIVYCHWVSNLECECYHWTITFVIQLVSLCSTKNYFHFQSCQTTVTHALYTVGLQYLRETMYKVHWLLRFKCWIY